MFPIVESSLGRLIILSSKKRIRLQCYIGYQSIRNYKKPIWVPIAPSKMYKNIVETPLPKMELQEVTALQETYKLYSSSLWKFQDGISREHEAQMQKEAIQVSEEVELERIFKMNDAENEKVKKIREESVIKEWEEVEAQILAMRKGLEEEELIRLEETEKVIQSELKRLEKVIKIEDLDEVIDKAMAAEWDYNFAIDKSGKIVQGRYNNSIGLADLSIPKKPNITPIQVAK
ncbi:unnamed protein product [Orchesella dallaii]|uniref:Small ribosomal subunit protein mS26 n=1 Tax=Orchesella dallaii TaxID=48710 RepID=A0ABP1QRC2_9HEXA